MFSLVTQADGSSRGHPLVSYALALLLIGFLVSSRFGSAGEEHAAAELRFDQVISYFEKHPYLELDAGMLDRLGGEERAVELEELFFADRRERGLSVIPTSIKHRGQTKLDRLVEEAYASRAELPPWQYGVRDTDSPPLNFIAHLVVHDSFPVLAFGLFFLLCLGIALEDVWGAAIYAVFCAVATLAGGVAYATLHADLGVPWYGSSGLVAAILGAYFVQSIRWPALLLGGLRLPGWAMPIAWGLGEYFLVRGLRPDSFDAAPLAAHGSGFFLGAVVAVVLRQTGIEKKLRARDEEASALLANPVLDKAMATHETGRTTEAFDLLKAEVERRPKDRDLALGFWTVARSCGGEAEAAPAMLTQIRNDLKQRNREEAVKHWMEVSLACPQLEVEATLLVRLGEALLDEGEPDEALLTLARALEGTKPPPPALARRIVRVARDLDPSLTSRAASLALADPHLSPAERERLRALSSDPVAAVSPFETVPASPDAASAAEPAASPEPVDLGDELPNALREETPAVSSEGSRGEDALHWNDPGLVEDLSAELADEEVGFNDEGLDAGGYDQMDYGAVNLEQDAEAPEPKPDRDDADSTVPMVGQKQSTTAVDGIEEGSDTDVDLGGDESRRLKVLLGVPLALEEASLKLDVDGRGKTRLPFDRLEAVAVAAVDGMGEQTVLVVDLVLNWMSLADEPLKVIRMRSDRYNPSHLLPETSSPVEAIRKLLEEILSRSDAAPLPDAETARGHPFATFPSLEAYHRDVLMVNGTADL
jgi:membrane associated rhomboid family serine protease